MQIHDYAQRGDEEGVARLLAEGVPVDSLREDDAYTPLMCAVTSEKASVELVRFLLERGANVNAIGQDSGAWPGGPVLALALRPATLPKIVVLLDA